MPTSIPERITSEKELASIAKEIISQNPKAAENYKSGEIKALDFLMGELMKATQKRADYKIARKMLEQLLS